MSKKLKHKWSEHVNSVIALCAILISGASFYATWLQADAADKQVTAMTLPLLSFDHGNILSDGKTPGISLRLHNGGMGPAVLHSATFVYEGNKYNGLGEWFDACCSDAKAKVVKLQEVHSSVPVSVISSMLQNVVISGQEKYEFLILERNQATEPMFMALNEARRKTAIETCYCSLLDKCYTATGLHDATPINACKD